MTEVNGSFRIAQASESGTELIHNGFDHRLELCDRLLGEEGVQWCSSHAVKIVWHGAEMRRRISKHARTPGPFVSWFRWASVDLVVVFRVVDVKLIRVNSHYGP